MRLTLIVAIAAVAACESGTQQWRVVLPPTDAESYALHLRAGDVDEVLIGSVAEPVVRDFEVDAEALELEVMLYAQSLEQLGFASAGSGRPDGSCRPCELGRPTETFRTTVRADVEPSTPIDWTAIAPRVALIERLVPDFSLECDSPCSTFRVEEVLIPTRRKTYVKLAAADALGVIVGLNSGAMVRIHPDRSTELICDDIPGTPSLVSGVRGQGDDLWWVRDNALQRIDLDAQDSGQPCQVATSTAPPYAEAGESLRYVAGGVDANGGLELIVASQRFLHRFDGTRWTSLGSLPERGTTTHVSWQPGRAVYVNGTSMYLDVVDGQVRALPSPIAAAVLFVSTILPNGVLVLGAGHAGLATVAGSAVDLYQPEWWTLPGSMLNFRGGALMTTEYGGFGHLFSDFGVCPMDRLLITSERVYRTAAYGDEFVVMADIVTDEVDRDTAVAILSPKSRCE